MRMLEITDLAVSYGAIAADIKHPGEYGSFALIVGPGVFPYLQEAVLQRFFSDLVRMNDLKYNVV